MLLIITVQQSDTYIYKYIYTIHSFYIHIIIYIIYMQILCLYKYFIYIHIYTFLFKTILSLYFLSLLQSHIITITFNGVCLSFCHLLFLEMNFWVCILGDCGAQDLGPGGHELRVQTAMGTGHYPKGPRCITRGMEEAWPGRGRYLHSGYIGTFFCVKGP